MRMWTLRIESRRTRYGVRRGDGNSLSERNQRVTLHGTLGVVVAGAARAASALAALRAASACCLSATGSKIVASPSVQGAWGVRVVGAGFEDIGGKHVIVCASAIRAVCRRVRERSLAWLFARLGRKAFAPRSWRGLGRRASPGGAGVEGVLRTPENQGMDRGRGCWPGCWEQPRTSG